MSKRVMIPTCLVLLCVIDAAAGTGNSKENSVEVSTECAAVLLVGGGAVGGAAAYALIVPLLALLGFTAAGVTGGSLAASWQSTMPMVTSGSLFATLQSIAMAGAGSGVVTMGTGVGAGTSALYLKQICAKVDSVEPDSYAAKMVSIAVATVQKADGVAAKMDKFLESAGVKEAAKSATNWIKETAADAGLAETASQAKRWLGQKLMDLGAMMQDQDTAKDSSTKK